MKRWLTPWTALPLAALALVFASAARASSAPASGNLATANAPTQVGAPPPSAPAPSAAALPAAAPQAAGDDADDADEDGDPSTELEDIRKAEEKAGLLPNLPGAERTRIDAGLGDSDPFSRDLSAALDGSLAGGPKADPQLSAGGAVVALPELAGISAEELRAKYDIPVELNAAVIAYVRFFQTDARPHFERWLSRSGRYLPMMRQILEREGVPTDLVYLSMIESGFSAGATSWVKAAGLWQFMVWTGRRYGLQTDFWVDERRDPVRSTVAASHYLRDLRERYHGDWYLAWAGYNAGEGKVDKAIRRDSSTDFWRLMDKGRTLRAETKHYVPKLIAAALISKHPERFGFRVELQDPFEFDEVTIAQATDLRVVAQLAGLSVDEVRDLNPQLRRLCTPPRPYALRLPKGSGPAFAARFQALSPEQRLAAAQHKVERGDSLSKIARAYGVSEAAILRANGLRSARWVRPGRTLTVPVRGGRGLAVGAVLAAVDRAEEPARSHKRHAQGRTILAAERAPVASGNAYTVKPGDSLWTIASRFNTTVQRLKKLNGLTGRRARALRVGQRIAV